jgi:urease accessory protein
MRTRHYAALIVSAALPVLAHAHHPMGGATPATAVEGLLSGFGHPVIGLDHLLFVLAIGAACYYFGQRAGAVATFLLATIVGTVLHLWQAAVPYPDAWVAVTLVLFGVLLLNTGPVLRSRAAVGLFALAGIAHGYAYGEAIVGAEQTPLFAYLAGLTAVQVLVVLAGYGLARFIDRKRPHLRSARAIGGTLSVAGAAFLLMSLSV